MVTLWLFMALTCLIGLERLAELIIAKRNARWSFAHGGREFGSGHYPWMVLIHTLLLLGGPLEAYLLQRPFFLSEAVACTIILLATQMLRWWCIRVLGSQWNTRVIVVPGLRRVARGPYRWLTHPNYVAVVLEGIALPLWHHSFLTALVFTILNFVILFVRIRCENQALATLKGGHFEPHVA